MTRKTRTASVLPGSGGGGGNRFRLPAGGRIDRAVPLRFTFDGIEFTGCRGDTLASALIANGVHAVGPSLYRRRPRGIVAAGSEEPNALVRLAGPCSEPMLLATAIELYDGLSATSLPGKGRLDDSPDPHVYDKKYVHADVLIVGGGPAGLAAALAAGGSGARVLLVDDQPEPGGSLLSEPPSRAPWIDGQPALDWVAATWAGLAALPEVRFLRRATAIGYYDHNYVVIAERRTDHLGPDPIPGVSRQRLWHVRARQVVLAAGAHEQPVIFADNDRPGVMLAGAVRCYVNRYAALPGQRAVVFTTNDDAYRTVSDLIAAGGHIAAIVDTRLRPPAALAGRARRAGVEVIAGAAVAGTLAGDSAVDSAGGDGNPHRLSGVLVSALDDGGLLTGPVREIGCDLLAVSGGWSPAVHLLRQSGGAVRYDEYLAAFVPGRSVQAERSAGAARGILDLAGCLAGGFAAGAEAAAAASMRSAPGTGGAGGGAGSAPVPSAAPRPPQTGIRGGRNDPGPVSGAVAAPRPVWVVPGLDGGPRDWDTHFVDLQRDATVADVYRASGAGMRSVEHIKRYTTIGTAHDQGKTSGVAAIGVIAHALRGHADGALAGPAGRGSPAGDVRQPGGSTPDGRQDSVGESPGTARGSTGNTPGIAERAGNQAALPAAPLGAGAPGEVGTTTFRPPYVPVCFALLAGRERGGLFDPERTTPMHSWHEEHGAAFEDVGQWKRARYYPRPGEDLTMAVLRECRAAREGVAVMDVSTLGKIDVIGPDAAEFLNRMYTNGLAKLAVGSARYGVLCKPDGMAFDDGVVLRLAPDHYYVTTTTGNAAAVLDWFEEWLQTEWPELRARCTSVTEQWATIAVAGPRARAVIAALALGLDVGAEAFPFMTARHTGLSAPGLSAPGAAGSGVPARICRISFSGELAFEINVASWYGLAVWEAVMAAGEGLGITPYGTETMHVLRAEKGYPIVGQDTDGTVTPQDLGMSWVVSRQKHFVGKRSHRRDDTARGDRKHLVALLPVDPDALLPEGAQLVAADSLVPTTTDTADRGALLAWGDTPPTPPAGGIARGDTALPREAPPDPDGPGPPVVPMLGHVTSSYRSAALGRTFALALVAGGRDRIGETLHAPLGNRVIAAVVADPVLYDKVGSRRDGDPAPVRAEPPRSPDSPAPDRHDPRIDAERARPWLPAKGVDPGFDHHRWWSNPGFITSGARRGRRIPGSVLNAILGATSRARATRHHLDAEPPRSPDSPAPDRHDPRIGTVPGSARLAGDGSAYGLRRSPLAHLAGEFAAAAVAGERGVRILEVPFLAQVSLRVDPGGAAAARIAVALGAPLPVRPGTVATAGRRRVLWLGPDEWLIVGPDGDAPLIEQAVRPVLGEYASLVDVSADAATIELSGPAARDVLEKGCSIDLHPRAFGPGRCAQTLVASAGVILDQVDAVPSYRLLVRASFARYLADWLVDATAEYRHPGVPRWP